MASGRSILLSSQSALSDFRALYPHASNPVSVARFATEPSPDLLTADALSVVRDYNLPDQFFYLPNQFWLHKNHRVVLTDDPKSAVDLTLGDAKSTLHLEQSESTLNGEQKLTVTGATIEIKASQKLVIEAPQIEMTARAELKVAGKPIRLN